MMWAAERAKYMYLSTFTVKSQRETLSEAAWEGIISSWPLPSPPGNPDKAVWEKRTAAVPHALTSPQPFSH